MAEEPQRGSYAIKLMYVCMYVCILSNVFTGQSPSSIFEEVLTYHCSKKDEPTIWKNLILHQPVLKFSTSNERPIFNKRVGELRLAYGKVIWFNEVKIVLKTQ